jgi:hypothetical protein
MLPCTGAVDIPLPLQLDLPAHGPVHQVHHQFLHGSQQNNQCFQVFYTVLNLLYFLYKEKQYRSVGVGSVVVYVFGI